MSPEPKGFAIDIQRSFADSILTLEAGTSFSRKHPLVHADGGERSLIRFLTTQFGDRTFFAKNEDAVIRGNGWTWTLKDSDNANWYQPPSSTISLISNENQKDIPIVHTFPFVQGTTEPQKRYVSVADIKLVDGP